MNDIIIASSILSADFSRLGEQIRSAEDAGVDWIHVDVMDGHFVPNITMGPFIVETCKKITNLPLDVHLMIDKPEKHIGAFASAGANHLSIHVENNPNIYRTLQEIKELGCTPGVVLNPGTPAYPVIPLIPLADMVLVMTVNPGFSGQKFIPETISKVGEVAEIIQKSGRDVLIQVDGGIGEHTLPLAYDAGARAFVAATAIFKHPQGIAPAVQILRNSVK
jgi:ribulose-phosphate 3-epimerase